MEVEVNSGGYLPSRESKQRGKYPSVSSTLRGIIVLADE